MKAVSLWQPWASLIAAGGKLIETRSWKTPYRGPLAVCASKATPRWALHAAFNEEEIFQFLKARNMLDDRRFPSGCVVAVCELVDCIRITPEYANSLSQMELAAGDYSAGRYAWQLANVKPLRTPLPVRSKQGLFEIAGVCRVCGCTDACSGCIERTVSPCYWVEPDLCSACVEPKINLVHRVLSRHRFDCSSEESLQEQIAGVLTDNEIEFQREVRLSPHDRIDFLVGGIGIEVKIKGSANFIYQQCRRYCNIEQIKELLLVTGRAMGFPPEIEGKPCYLLNLGRSWL